MMASERLRVFDYIIHGCFFDEWDGIRDGHNNDLGKIFYVIPEEWKKISVKYYNLLNYLKHHYCMKLNLIIKVM